MQLSARLFFVLGTISCCFIFCSAAFILEKGQKIDGDSELVPFASANVEEAEVEEARRKKKDRYAFATIIAALMMKAVLFPLAFKAMAVMSSVAVLLSTMSLIATSIVGYTKLAWSKIGAPVKVVRFNDAWAKEDGLNSYEDESSYYDTIGPIEEHVHYYQRRKST